MSVEYVGLVLAILGHAFIVYGRLVRVETKVDLLLGGKAKIE